MAWAAPLKEARKDTQKKAPDDTAPADALPAEAATVPPAVALAAPPPQQRLEQITFENMHS
ncbi:hypothetical protein [Desulfovibrio legallii]|uniref:Uncharacterized protein n=1 Tax=Desulfovibrio legallii TaxID=571438 RepID=A0A1G7ITN5_9BACT|nr:hypothetical protein [Desulfovibrio legallii]SDF16102.1 hypothetical protein SAMN05192586_10270 [Desulfovibrio legallii]